MGDYWPSVIELAPYLQPGDRATLFAVLWGGIEDLSETYLRLRHALDYGAACRYYFLPT